jgi:Flp pilus assembly protein TadD
VQEPATPASPAEPETFDSLIVKGDLAFQAGNYQNALNAYSAAYKMKPRSPEARRKIAVALTMLGRVDEAQKYQ